jgi:hypothetical protein
MGIHDVPPAGAFGHDTFLVVSAPGFILQSEPLSDTAPGLSQPVNGIASSLDAPVTLQAAVMGSSPIRYQWRRDGTNLPSATTPYLTLTAADVSTSRITVAVENAFGAAESDPATATLARPAELRLAPDLSSVSISGTPDAVYRLEYSVDLATWQLFSEIQMTASGRAVPVFGLGTGLSAAGNRFFRALYSRPPLY